jgi:hypothetical protein
LEIGDFRAPVDRSIIIFNPSQKNCQLFFNSCSYNIRLTDTGSYSLNAQVQCGRISCFT